MVSIKLRPVGKTKQISYRVAVMEKGSKLKGRFIEDLGFYNPHSKAFSANKERATYWLGVGARSTATVHNLFVTHKVTEGKKIPVHKHKKSEPVVAGAKTEELPEGVASVAVETPNSENSEKET